MKNDPRSHGLWAISAPPAPATTPLKGDLTTEVAIIGAGYTGLSTALHLAERGVQTVLIEAAQIGHGGAGRNVGLVNAGMWVMPDQLVRVMGPDFGPRLIDCLGKGPAQVWALIRRYGIECEAHHNGTLHVAADAKGLVELGERAMQWRNLGAPVQKLDAQATAARLGTDHYHGALWDKRAGTIQPLAYARGLAGAAMAEGARIFTQSPALNLSRQGGMWRIETPQGAVLAPKVVFGTDAYTSGPMQRQIRDQQVMLPYFNFATSPLPPEVASQILPGREGVWDTKEILTSFRFDDRNRLIFGSVGALRNTGAAVHQAWARRALSNIFPQIGKVEFEAGWYGQIGMTQDNLPRFHKLEDGIFTICGYNGRGIAPGTVFGGLMAAYVIGQIGDDDLPLPVTTPASAPFRQTRALTYEIGAQLAHFTGARR